MRKDPAAVDSGTAPRLVWDLPLRLFHWLLATSITASWITAEAGFDWRVLHMQLGYFTIGLLIFRIVWGFIGPRHARFLNFLQAPPKVLGYLRAIGSGESTPQSVGHNPLGALMVIAMLLLIAIQTATGLFTSDDIVYAGPYNPAVSDATAKTLGHVHHINFNIILGAIALHLTAVAFYTWGKKHRLIGAMVTGYKAAHVVPMHESIQKSELLKGLIVAAVSALLVYALLSAAPVPSASNAFN